MLQRHPRLTEAQRDLIERNWDHIFQIARNHAEPGTPLEEIYDATVETAIATAAKFNRHCGSYAGFFSFCVDRTLFKYYRQRIKKEVFAALRDEVGIDMPPPPIAEQEVATIVMSMLSGRERAVIQMTFYDGMTESEIAKVFDCTYQNIQKIKQKALARLRRRLKYLL
jgi:RNA polymerase sigma factor (sigma-70 family)